jgi:hypothetical protein
VFVPFQRLGDTDNTSGVGLGLALSRGLTEVMGGTLDPEETPGGGLTMIISLPAAAAARRPAAASPGRRERDQAADGAARPVARYGPGIAASTDGADAAGDAAEVNGGRDGALKDDTAAGGAG